MTWPGVECVAAVRDAMAGPGFALIATPPPFGDALCVGGHAGRSALRPDSGRWWRHAGLARYAVWLEGLLAAALPAEGVSLTELEVRREPIGRADAVADRLHADGSYVRTVHALYGPTTLYREGGVERPVPDGHTLIMTAQDRTRAVRVPCTLHRRPGPGPERAVIVCSFEPGTGDEEAAVYRRAASGCAAGGGVSGTPRRARRGRRPR